MLALTPYTKTPGLALLLIVARVMVAFGLDDSVIPEPPFTVITQCAISHPHGRRRIDKNTSTVHVHDEAIFNGQPATGGHFDAVVSALTVNRNAA